MITSQHDFRQKEHYLSLKIHWVIIIQLQNLITSMNLVFIIVKRASGVYALTYRRNNVTSSRRREYMTNMTSWYLRLAVNIFVNFWISWEMKTSPRSWKSRLFEYVKFRKSIFYDIRALFSRRQSYGTSSNRQYVYHVKHDRIAHLLTKLTK